MYDMIPYIKCTLAGASKIVRSFIRSFVRSFVRCAAKAKAMQSKESDDGAEHSYMNCVLYSRV